MTTLEQVKEFHKVFGQPILDAPEIQDIHVNNLRMKLLFEEVKELEVALLTGTEEEALDALTDIQYVLDGTYLALGFHKVKDKAFNVVHEANMKKLGPNNKPIYRADGKVIKPSGWQPPNLKLVLATLQ